MMALEAAWGSGVPWLAACKAEEGRKAHKLSLQCLCCCSPQANQIPPLLIVFGKLNCICKDVPTQPSLTEVREIVPTCNLWILVHAHIVLLLLSEIFF